ncbi:aspartyl protease family protein 1 isoform X2 [Hevea brasiliensis]|uniref:aspartyl protease family protein 1 isoform X2 n=1 Tax=Hevea brasiliensis TaxID=3981 RepID=UPI0025F63C80|nr:aspartyl protease family protein 1 isoform X2 [Hevea brasiliensis]
MAVDLLLLMIRRHSLSLMATKLMGSVLWDCNLYYANVSVGTPGLSFLVALDTGSDLFWLPCDSCRSCFHRLQNPSGEDIPLNVYSINESSTGKKVPWNSSLCSQQNRCFFAQSDCCYQALYLSENTLSIGFLVEDLLHLTTDDTQQKAHNATITFGCGERQTGAFSDGAAPNGLFGLGMGNLSVPSTLARERATSNSFSMCFGPDGIGRISFGDTGNSYQEHTPFNLMQSNPTYNISITKVKVGRYDSDLEFTAIFESGASFTYLNEPAYSFISESFNNQTKDKRYSFGYGLPFKYCYEISSYQDDVEVPILNLVMEGGSQFNVTDPIVLLSLPDKARVYCLGIVKSENGNIIGQNFMTGYRIVFDREKNVLGWKPSNCYDLSDSNTLRVNPTSPGVSPAASVNQEATTGNGNNSNVFREPLPPANHSPQLNPFIFAFITVLISFFTAV